MAPTPQSDETGIGQRRGRWTPRRIGCAVLVGLLLVLIVHEWLVGPLINPLRRSDSEVAADLLERTPIGSSRSDVKAFVTAQGYWPGENYGWKENRCEQLLGSYWSFGFRVCVYADWFLGPDERLQRVEVWRMVIDGL